MDMTNTRHVGKTNTHGIVKSPPPNIPSVIMDTKHVTSHDITIFQEYESHVANIPQRRQCLKVPSPPPVIHTRRVRFQQHSQKSKSLETPYHHTHHERTLAAELSCTENQERSSSYNCLPPSSIIARMSVATSYITPAANLLVRQSTIDSGSANRLQAQRMRQYQQRSFSADDLSPASEHEKWEKELSDNIWRQRPPSVKGVRRDPPNSRDSFSPNRLETASPSRLVQPALAKQRSFSEGNISPSCEKWEQEAREHDKLSIGIPAKRRSFLVRDKTPELLLPGEVYSAHRGLRIVPMKEIHNLTTEMPSTSRELGDMIRRESSERLIREAAAAAIESEIRASTELPALKKQQQEEMEKQLAVQRAAAVSLAAIKLPCVSKDVQPSVSAQSDSTNGVLGSAQKANPEHIIKKTQQRVTQSDIGTVRKQQYQCDRRYDPETGREERKSMPTMRSNSLIPVAKQPPQARSLSSGRSSFYHSKDLSRDGSPTSYAQSKHQGMKHLHYVHETERLHSENREVRDMRDHRAAHLSSLAHDDYRTVRSKEYGKNENNRSSRKDVSPSHISQGQGRRLPEQPRRVNRHQTLTRQKEINAHIRPMDYKGTQIHLKEKRQLMLQERKSHSFESSFEDHFFHDLKYEGRDLKEVKKERQLAKDSVTNANQKRILMVRDRKERKSNSLDSSFEVAPDADVFVENESQGGDKLFNNPKTSREKRLQAFHEQKSYSFECPSSMEKFHSKTHCRVDDLRKSDISIHRPRRELPKEPVPSRRKTSSGPPHSPHGQGSPHNHGSSRSPRSPRSPRSTSGRGSPHSKSSQTCNKDIPLPVARERSPQSYHERERSHSMTVRREHVSSFCRSPEERSDRKMSCPLQTRHGSTTAFIDITHSRMDSASDIAYRARENSLINSQGTQGSREFRSHSRERSTQFFPAPGSGSCSREISPKQSREQSREHSRDRSREQSRDRSRDHSRDKHRESSLGFRSQEHSPYHSRDPSPYTLQVDINRPIDNVAQNLPSTSRRDLFKQQKSYSLEIPITHDSDYNGGYVSPRYEGLATLQESIDSHDEKSLEGFDVSSNKSPSPIVRNRQMSQNRRMQQFKSQKSCSLDIPCPSIRCYEDRSSTPLSNEQRQPSPINISLLNVDSDPTGQRRMQLLKQKSKSIDVPYAPQEAKDYCKQKERRSYDSAYKQVCSKEFDTQMRKLLMRRRGMTVDVESRPTTSVLPLPECTPINTYSQVQRSHKMRTFKEQKSYSLDVPDKGCNPEFCVKRERSPSEAYSLRPVVFKQTACEPDQNIGPMRSILETTVTVLEPENIGLSSNSNLQARKELFSKQKSYSINVPPSEQHHAYYYDPYCDDQSQGQDQYSSTNSKRRQNFVHQKSYSVDVPSAEIGDGKHIFKLPERKVESDSKIQVHFSDKRPTHKRLQFLRYLTEQGTLSFDDGGKPIPITYPPTKTEIISSDTNANVISDNTNSSPTHSNRNRRQSLLLLHNMKAVTEVSQPVPPAADTERTLLALHETTEAPILKTVPFSEPYVETTSDIKTSSEENRSAIAVQNPEGIELKGILKNKDDPIYIKQKDRDSSWKWKILACAAFLTSRRSVIGNKTKRRAKLSRGNKSTSVDYPAGSAAGEKVVLGSESGAAYPYGRNTAEIPQSSKGSSGSSSGISTPRTGRSRFLSNKSISLDTELLDSNKRGEGDSRESPYSSANTSFSPHSGSANCSPKLHARHLGNVFVVMYNFKPREKDDLELRLGARVVAIDSSDPDWWKGKSCGRVGYFPSMYVMRLLPGERAMQIASGVEVSEDSSQSLVKLHKDEIVIQEGNAQDGMVMIRTRNKRFPCPVRYLTDVQISA